MDVRRLFASLFFLVLLPITMYPVFAAEPGTIIEQAATLYIGEEGLNVTHALNQAQGNPAIDGVPPLTTIGWWASASPFGTAPSKTIDLSGRYTSLTVAPSDFVGYSGNWYVLQADGVNATGMAFTVADPTLDIRIWDYTTNSDVTGTAVPRGTHLGFRIDTNMYGATSHRTPLNPATDGFIDILVVNEAGVTYPALYHYSTDEGALAGPGSLLANYVNAQPFYWGSPSLAWNTSALTYGTFIYPEGTYTVHAVSTLHNMRANYQNNYADFTGKTVSPLYTITIVPESGGGGGGTDAGSTAGGTTSSVAIVPDVAAGAVATFSFAPVITGTAPAGVTGVQLVTTRTLGQTEITVTNLPAGTLTGPDQPVAGYMDIVAVGINPNAIDHATITFSVYKEWLTERGLTPSAMVGAYDNEGVWTNLPTTYTGETQDSYTFTMTTEKLGYFAITVLKPGIAPAIQSEKSRAETTNSESYSLGFTGMSFNADGQGTLDISLADAQAAGATVTLYLNRVEVYQHHSPGVTITFWGDNFTITRDRIGGKVSRAEFVTDPLNATLDLGNVSGSVHAVLPELILPGRITSTLSENASAGTLAQFAEIAQRNNLRLTSTAFTFTLSRVNLTTGPANVTFSVPASWADAHGGRDSVWITRISDETGREELLNTTYVSTDAGGFMTFRGDSPNGTSLFGLITAGATESRQEEQPNMTYIPPSKPAMVTNVGMFGWLAGILADNPLLILVVIAVLAAALYFGWWKRRL